MYCCIFLIYDFGIRNGSHDLGNDVIGASQLQFENIELQ